jgi:hypothetical protein
VEGVEEDVMKSLDKQQKSEYRRNAKGRRKEPTGLSKWVDEKYRSKYGNRTRKSNQKAIAL